MITAESSSGTLDRYAELLALMDGDEALLHELIDVFLEDAPQRLAAVRAALSARDAGALYKAAHALKGSAGNFGAPEVVGHAVKIEALAREGNIDAAAIVAGFLEGEMERLVDDLAVARRPS